MYDGIGHMVGYSSCGKLRCGNPLDIRPDLGTPVARWLASETEARMVYK